MADKFGLVCDWESSGLLDTNSSYKTFVEGPQGIEIGAILVNLKDFTPLEEFSSFVRFLGGNPNTLTFSRCAPLYAELTWDKKAEDIHGISIESLEEAPSPYCVAYNLRSMIRRYAKPDDRIMFCGHNPIFDMYCTKQLMFLGGMTDEIKFHHRMIDTFSLGKFLYNTKSSKDLFKLTSDVVRNGAHRALEDARLTLKSLQKMYTDTKVLRDNLIDLTNHE